MLKIAIALVSSDTGRRGYVCQSFLRVLPRRHNVVTVCWDRKRHGPDATARSAHLRKCVNWSFDTALCAGFERVVGIRGRKATCVQPVLWLLASGATRRDP
jgi:hypothetical protein